MKRTTLLVALLATSCTPPSIHVKADRAIFDDVAPRYTRYLEGDSSLNEADRKTFLRTVETWRILIEKREEAAK